MMKKVFVMILAALMLLSAAACGSETAETTLPAETTAPAEHTRPAGPVGGVQIANPFIPCETLEEAAEIAGFSMTVDAQQPEWAAEVLIHGVQEGMIEVIYAETGDFAEGDRELRLRKASGERDISGVYGGDYTETQETVGEQTVTVSERDGLVYQAQWFLDGYTCFLRSAEGMSREELSGWVQAIA